MQQQVSGEYCSLLAFVSVLDVNSKRQMKFRVLLNWFGFREEQIVVQLLCPLPTRTVHAMRSAETCNVVSRLAFPASHTKKPSSR